MFQVSFLISKEESSQLEERAEKMRRDERVIWQANLSLFSPFPIVGWCVKHNDWLSITRLAGNQPPDWMSKGIHSLQHKI